MDYAPILPPALDGSLTITNTGSAHAGKLQITGATIAGVNVPSVQVLAFGPSRDPLEIQNTIEATAGTIYVTGPLNNRVVIDSGATAEFGAANNTANGGSVGVRVVYNDAGGTLKLDNPAQNLTSTPNAFNGQIILSARQTGTSPFDRLDLTGQSVSSATMNGTTLTVTTGGWDPDL